MLVKSESTKFMCQLRLPVESAVKVNGVRNVEPGNALLTVKEYCQLVSSVLGAAYNVPVFSLVSVRVPLMLPAEPIVPVSDPVYDV